MGLISNGYLIAYNLGLTIGWSYVLFLAVEKRNDYTKMWNHVEIPLKLFQTAAVLEILHAAIGIVRTNVFTTLIQVFSRVFVIWCVMDISKPASTSIGVPMCLIAWGITEIIRYGYYFLNLIGMAKLLVWLRYTLFIVLYPLGISGELICMYLASNDIKNQKLWTYTMPNALNFTFDFYFVTILIMLSYIPFFPQLYLYMFGQRRKTLGGKPKTT